MTALVPILEFDGVRWTDLESPLQFRLEPGGCVFVRTRVGNFERAGAIGRVACGLAAPPHGTIRFRGREWAEMTPAEAERARAAIGRVLSGAAWISNLDVEENVLLSPLHHGRRPRAELRAEAKRLARSFGLDDVPAGRAAGVPRRDLQRAQWVRALLINPLLLVLEFPERETLPSEQAAFAAAVDEARTRGAGVVWITDREPAPKERNLCIVISDYSLSDDATGVESQGKNAYSA